MVYLGCNDRNRCSSHHACQHLLFPIDHLLQLCPLQGCHYIARQGIPWMSSIHLCFPNHHLTRSLVDDSFVPAVMTVIHMFGNDQEYEFDCLTYISIHKGFHGMSVINIVSLIYIFLSLQIVKYLVLSSTNSILISFRKLEY